MSLVLQPEMLEGSSDSSSWNTLARSVGSVVIDTPVQTLISPGSLNFPSYGPSLKRFWSYLLRPQKVTTAEETRQEKAVVSAWLP